LRRPITPLLAESHISIHTWPEFGFAAADIFMCGDAAPQLALDVIESALAPASRVVRTIARGGAGSL
jgi:S-adenosylmethionine decarboxylase